MRQELIDTIWNWFSAIWKLWSFSFESLWRAFMDTPLWSILSFLWGIIEFIFFAFKSIVRLIWDILYTVLDWSVSVFSWVTETFENLSLYMWKPTVFLFELFCIVLMLLIFQFIIRILFWKFHYKKMSK